MAKAKSDKVKGNLVIVESPAKAKTIEKYLGPGYTVKASMGHLRDLPKSKIGVDLEGDFTPDYQPIKGKEDTIKDLKKAAKNSEYIYLATDLDREGEAISWHLKEMLGMPEDKTFRVTFNEITKKAVNHAIENPRSIDQNLVDAQQARRILDRIVGYQLSPLLWKKIRRGLSAGRVQSVATRLVCEREALVQAFVPQEYWSIEIKLDRIAPNLGSFTAQFHGIDKKMELHSFEETQDVMNKAKADQFIVTKVKKSEKRRSPAPPFTTSSLQQDASRKFSMTPANTMSVAQRLYEGGYITYMRTDSLRLSDDAVDAARNFIEHRYGKDYIPPKAIEYKSKSGAQDAHEAIRPSDGTLTPEELRVKLKEDLIAIGDKTERDRKERDIPAQVKLYRLIWSRFLACQMTPAVYDTVSIDSTAGGYIFRASHTSLKFSGFTAVYEEGKDEEDSAKKQSPLPNLEEGEKLSLADCKEHQHFTQPPARYSEATLIRALEEKGIGRPSTYAPTISTIINKEYVVKEGKALKSTPLGEVINGLLTDKFSDVVDPTFTAQMEEKLDKVELGEVHWKGVLADFYGEFHANFQKVEEELDGERIKVPEEVTEELCDDCGKNLVIKSGRFGRFLACPGWPDCSFTKPLVIEMPGKCPLCESRILKKTSRRGYAYYGCEKNSEKDEKLHCDFMTWDVPVKENCPVCDKTLFKKSGRGAKKPFCITESCELFVPEEKRGGYRKKPAAKEGEETLSIADGAEPPVEEKKTDTKKKTTKASSKSTKSTAKSTSKASTKGKKVVLEGEETPEKKTVKKAVKKATKAKSESSDEDGETVKKATKKTTKKKSDKAKEEAVEDKAEE